MLPYKKRAQFLCSDESMKVSQFGNPDDDNLKDTEEENKTDTFLTSCTTLEKDALAESMRHVGDDETKGVKENEGGGGGGDGRSIGSEAARGDGGDNYCVGGGEKQEEETMAVIEDDGCGDSAVGDGKKEDGTKEVVEKECGGLLEHEKMAEIEDVGHDRLNNNALDIVGDEKEEETREVIHQDGCGDSAVGDGNQEDGTKEVVEKECGGGGLLEQEKMAEIKGVGHDRLNNNALDIVGDEKEEETREVIHDGCGDSALGDGKQEYATKEVVEKECGGLLEQQKMAEIEGVGHDCGNNALDIVGDEKQEQSVDPVKIVEGSSSHCAIDNAAEFIKGGKGEGEDHGQVAEMVDVGGDENIRNIETGGEEETKEANDPLKDVVSIIVHDGGSGGEQMHEAEENELRVIHQPVRKLRLFGVDIEVPQEEVQPTTGTGTDTSLTNQESNGRGLSLPKPKIGLRLMGFDL